MEPVHAAAAAQEERRPGPLLQRPDRGAGEEVRHAEVPVPPREETAGQDAAAQRETGERTGTGSVLIGRLRSGLLQTVGDVKHLTLCFLSSSVQKKKTEISVALR